jgi:hypothetical protein
MLKRDEGSRGHSFVAACGASSYDMVFYRVKTRMPGCANAGTEKAGTAAHATAVKSIPSHFMPPFPPSRQLP